MAREIRLSAIVDEKFKQDIIKAVKSGTFFWEEEVARNTPVDTGRLRRSWTSEVTAFKGVVSTNVEYAEPVAYGTSLPPSWQGRYRTRPETNTIKGYPELIAKQVQQHIEEKFGRL